MKKHLIAAAVAAAVAVPAMAQVTMSGRLDTSVGQAKNNAGQKSLRMQSDLLTSNQLVFSGSEDLGGGLKANFNISSGFASDQSNNAATSTNNAVGTFVLGSRGMQVGVSGGFGAIDFGKTTGTMMNSTAASGLTGNIGNLSPFEARPNNSISYTTPAASGMTFRLVYGLGSEAVARNTNKHTEGSVQYSAGPLLVRAAYSVIANASRTATVAATTNNFGSTSNAVIALTDDKITETGAQVDYNLGVARVNFRLQTRTHSVAENTSIISGARQDFTQYGIGAAVPFGSTTFAADYATTDSKRPDGAGDTALMSLTASNALSKRTNVYAAYAGLTNSANPATATSKDSSLFAVGVRHSF